MKKSIFAQIILLSLAGFILASCSAGENKTNVELIQDMYESPALDAQEFDQGAPNNSSMRLPPEGTQPVGFVPYKYAKDAAGAVRNQNPMGGDFSEESLKVGLKFYQTNCTICHGEKGEGGEKTSVGALMPVKPPTLISDKVKGYTDGQLFHIITVGQGVMGPYASHIPQQYRWQVVNYIRHLQKEAK